MSVNNNLQVGSARIRVAKFTASGTWTAPAGVYTIQVLAVGGGGGGGGATSSGTSQHDGGGGGGGGVFDGLLTVVPGTNYTVTIGTGGAGASSGAVASSNGSNTTFGSIMTAPGGQGGVSQNSSVAVVPTTNPGGSWGGPSAQRSTTSRGSSSAGGGAGSPVVLASVSSGQTATSYNFFDGFGQRSFPLAVFNTGALMDKSIWQPRSGDTWYPNIKRNNSLMSVMSGIWAVPGWSWKDLGAGGAPAYYAGGDMFDLTGFVHGSAGKIDLGSVTTGSINFTSAQAKNGLPAKDNSGAGGGGAFAVGSGPQTGSGGAGGSGYLEIVWQE